MIIRAPIPALRPFVARVWAAAAAPFEEPQGTGVGAGESLLERVLPSGRMHLVIRLGGDPLRLHEGDRIRGFGFGVIGGARSGAYVREVSGPVSSVGAVLLPGASALLFGAPAEAFAEAHTELEPLWRGAALELRDGLLEEATAEGRLRLFEGALLARLARLTRLHGLHPALHSTLHPGIAQALALFGERAKVGRAVAASGLSHRRFIELFRREVGLTPKRYCRVRRLQRVIHASEESWARGEDRGWASLAFEAGYADQAHLSRELKAITGLSPSAYRAALPRHPNHVPVTPSSAE